MEYSRRNFIGQVAGITGLALLSKSGMAQQIAGNGWFEISLAQWSLHNALYENKITNLDFPGLAKNKFGISVVEYVSPFFDKKEKDTSYLNELLKRCKDNGIKNHLIMVDAEGDLGNGNEKERKVAVENHYKWVDTAKYLGCATIRVNAYGTGSAEEVQKAAIASLTTLGEYAAKENINVVVENHGGYSSDGQWMLKVLSTVNKPNVGMLPDFGNFCVRLEKEGDWSTPCIEEYDKYKGVKELMPFAKGISAKAMNFDEKGNCVETDYERMMKIIKDAGFKGYVGIEFSGDIPEEEGILKTKALLEKFRVS